MTTLEGVNPQMIANNLKPFQPTHPGEVLKDPQDRCHVEKGRRQSDRDDDCHALHQLPRACVLDPQQDMICQISYDENLDKICPPYIRYTELGKEINKIVNSGKYQFQVILSRKSAAIPQRSPRMNVRNQLLGLSSVRPRPRMVSPPPRIHHTPDRRIRDC